VQWYDVEDESWRGVAPRQTAPEILLPWSLLKGRQVRVRVLATTGLNTGAGEVTVDGRGGKGQDGAGTGYQVMLLDQRPDPAGAPVRHPSAVLHAVAVDAMGKTAAPSNLAWYDTAGAQLARGADLDTRQLPRGKHQVRAVVRDPSSGTATGTSWQVEVGSGNPLVHRATPMANLVPAPAPAAHKHPHP
jgi:hypothetical protein